MLNIENDSSSIREEPVVYNSSTSSNLGIRAIFSDRKQSFKKSNLLFTPSIPHNNRFSFYNTIMEPIITTVTSVDYEKNNLYNNINKKKLTPVEKINISLKKDNTWARTESSKEEKNINVNDEKQLSKLFLIDTKEANDKLKEDKNNIEKTNFEKNPFFLGQPISLSYSKNITPKTIIINNENSDEEKNYNYNEFFLKKETSKSLNFTKNKNKVPNKEEDKSNNTLKIENLSLQKAFINKYKKKEAEKEKKKEKEKDRSRIIKGKSYKKKISFIMKNPIKDKDKDDILKTKKDKGRNDIKYHSTIDKKRKNYYSNKCVKDYSNINIETISKKTNLNMKELQAEREKKQENKNKKKKPFERLKTQRFQTHFSKKIKNEKEEKNEKLKAKISNKYSSIQSKKAVLMLQEYIKTKENNENKDKNNFKEKNRNEEKKQTEYSNKRFKSKNEIIRISVIKKDLDEDKKNEKLKQKIKKGKSLEKSDKELLIYMQNTEDEKGRFHSNKKMNYKDKNDMESNKSLTGDINRKKSVGMIDKYLKFQNSSSSVGSKKSAYRAKINLFGKTNYKKKINIDFENTLKNNLKKTQFNLFYKDKFTNTEFTDCDYLKYTLDCMELILDIDIEKQIRLKNKINFNFPKQKKNKIKKKIALFDLDETLVHCTGDIKIQKEKYQHSIEIKLPGKNAVQVGINLRPYWKQTLNLIKKNYHIVIYTASHQAYADAVLDFMDPKKKYFKHRLYRNNCSLIDVDGAKFYVKDLDIFNEYYDLKDIIIVDNSVLSFAYHLHNGIPIVPYYDEDKDGSLYVVGLYLMHIFNEDDLREANRKQINLDSFMEEAKKQKEEYVDPDQIDEESDSKEDDNENNNVVKPLEKIKPKISGKKSLFNVKKKSSKYLLSTEQKEQNDLAQKKLMGQSKLINMYYEVKDKSNEAIKSNTKILENIREKNEDLGAEEDNKANIIFYENENDNDDCKSAPGHCNFEHDIDEEDEEEHILIRGKTIIHDFLFSPKKKEGKIENKSVNSCCKNKNRTKLGFIRSNFYNKFKI